MNKVESLKKGSIQKVSEFSKSNIIDKIWKNIRSDLENGITEISKYLEYSEEDIFLCDIDIEKIKEYIERSKKYLLYDNIFELVKNYNEFKISSDDIWGDNFERVNNLINNFKLCKMNI